MTTKFALAGAVLAAALTLGSPAFAGANDYVFEPVQAEMKKGDGVVVSVRLRHKATGKAVADAVIIRSRVDMGPDGMADMTAPTTKLPSPEPGVYAFKTSLSHGGRWQLTVSAKVQGEAETITGKVVVKATD